MKYKAVIFDLDGTILSTLDDLADSLNYALKTNGLPERTVEQTRMFVGNGIRKLMELGVPEGTPTSVIDKVHADFTGYYVEHCADKTKPYDGILETLDRLKSLGVKTAVLSNKADYAVKSLCDRYFKGYLDEADGEKPGVPKKPAPDGVLAALEKLGVDLKDAVYVGDSEVDIETAENTGIDCVIVSWGFRDVETLRRAGAKVIVSTPKELADALI